MHDDSDFAPALDRLEFHSTATQDLLESAERIVKSSACANGHDFEKREEMGKMMNG